MTTVKIHIVFLLSLFAFCLQAQVDQQVGYKSEYLDQAVFSETPQKTADTPRDPLARTEAIYKTLYQCQSKGIMPYFAGKIKWNDQENHVFSWENPSLANLFDELIPEWAVWKFYDLTYQESPNNVITVSGHYRVIYHGRAKDASFIHVWTWKADQVIAFQSFSGLPPMAQH